MHVSSIRQAAVLARLPRKVRALMDRFWPGPLTLVLPKKRLVPGIVTAGLDTVAVRILEAFDIIEDLFRQIPQTFPRALDHGLMTFEGALLSHPGILTGLTLFQERSFFHVANP